MHTPIHFLQGKRIAVVNRLFWLVLLSFCCSLNALAQTPSVTTDKADYLPGDVVVIEGENWQPGEQVRLEIDHSTISHGNTVLAATADASGRIYNNQYLIQPVHLGESFTLLATGLNSGWTATTTFTDGNAPSSITILPPAGGTRALYGTATDITYTVKIARAGGPGNSGFSVNLAVSSSGLNSFTTRWANSPVPAGTYTLNVPANTAEATVSLTVSTKPTASVAMIHFTVTGTTSSGGGGIVTVTDDDSFTITPQPVTITPASSQSKRYTEPDPVFGYSNTAGLGSSFSGTLSRAPGEAVGSYPYQLGTLSAGSNYQLSLAGAEQFRINPAVATLTLGSLSGQVYDGNPKPATVTTTPSGLSGLTLLYDGAAAVPTNAGSYAVTATLSNASYSAAPATGTLHIAPAPATISLSLADLTPTYDGNPHTVGAVASPAAAGVAVAYSQNGSIVPAPTQAGSYLVTATLTNANYQLTTATGGPVAGQQLTAQLRIGKAAQVLSWAAPASLEYGGALGSPQLSATRPTGDGNLSYQPGSGTVLAAVPHTLTVLAAETSNFLPASATVLLTVTSKPLTPVVTAASKTYDTTPAATLSSQGLSGGIVGNDAVALTGGTASFPDKRVGSERLVTATGLQLTGAASVNYSLTSSTATTTATISAATVTGDFTAASKTYDGTPTASILTRTLHGILGQDEVRLVNGTAAFASGMAGPTQAVTGVAFALSGPDAPNYQLAATTLTTTATIQRLAVTASFTALHKEYDGTATATVSSRHVAGVLGNDDVSLAGGSASFADRHAGPSKPVTLSGATLAGAAAPNYQLTTVAAAAADITPLRISGAFTAAAKPYDGTAAALVLTRTVNGVIDPDVVELTGGSGAFADKAAGPNKPVALTGAGLGGAQAGNYTLAGVSPATAAITPRPLLITATGIDKVYDGNTAATVTLQDNRLGGDQLTPGYGTAAFASRHAGTGKAITVSELSISGPDASNYAANSSASTSASIFPKVLTIALQASNKEYDGSSQATVAAVLEAGSGLVAPDAVTVAATNGQFADPYVGSGKPVTASVSKAGPDAGNYVAATTATASAAITQRLLTASLRGTSSKPYDQTTAASLTAANYALANAVAGDAVGLNEPASGQYDTKHAGAGKTVTVSGVALTGTAAANYALAATTLTGPVGHITARPLLVTAAAQGKVYDGTTAARVSLADNRLSGDELSASYGSATFTDKRVGLQKVVTVAGLVTTGPDAGNYAANTSATATASISPLELQATLTASHKTYDGLRIAAATASLNGLIPDDEVAAVVTGGLFDTPWVGTNKPVEATLTLAGVDAPNYTVASTLHTTAHIRAREVTASIVAQNKTYDGTATAAATGAVPSASLITGDVVTVVVSNAAFATPGAGVAKPVQAAVALSGAAAANYQLTALTASTTATILPLPVTGTFTAASKVYDGTVAATITGRALVGVLPVDAGLVGLAGGSASFGSAAVGTGKEVVATGLSLNGAAAPNYSLSSVAPAWAAITAAEPGLVVANLTGQYSDNVTLVATLTSPTVQAEVNSTGGTVEFLLKSAGGSTQSVGSSAYPEGWAVVAGKATAARTVWLTQAPGTYTVQAVYTPNAGNIASVTSLTAGTLQVRPEHAEVTYTGETYYTVPSASATKFNILLSATVRDITALPHSPFHDATAGDITQARVTFRQNSPNGPILGSAPVALVSSDTKVGTASVLYTCPISTVDQNGGGLTLMVYSVVESYYTSAVESDPVTVTLSMPGADFVTGGGHVVNSTSSRGVLAGTAGAKTNFGFTMKYTKSGTNIKGQCNLIVRSAGRIYQIKSNAINTLSVGGTTAAGTPAYFNTKASYTDITDPLNPVPGPGNLDLTVWMNDVAAGGQADAVGMQLLSGSQLLFASSWNGLKTVTQVLGGGNVQVRSLLAAPVAALRPSGPTGGSEPAALPASTPTALAEELAPVLVVYPSPVTDAPATVHFRSRAGGKAQLYVYNETGMLVATLYNAEVRRGQNFEFSLPAQGWPRGLYLCRLIANGRVFNHRFVVAH